MTAQQTVVRLQRNISAPPERVYRAWLEPELLQRWLAPGSMQVVRAEVDERVGGHYRLTVTLREAPGASTELTLVHEHLDALRDAMPEVADGVESGWTAVLNKLTETMHRAKS
jgi:uncharacterized protein YndB with AHSA1/START domain